MQMSWTECIKFMTKISAGNILVRKKEPLSTDKAGISSKKMGLSMMVNGETTGYKGRDRVFSDKGSWNIQANGNLTSITDGELSIRIQQLIQNGFLMKEN